MNTTDYPDFDARVHAESMREMAARLEEAEAALKLQHVMTARYHVPTRTIHFSPAAAEFFGVERSYGNFPESYVEMGMLSSNVDQFIDFYYAIIRGDPRGAANSEMLVANGEHRLFNRQFRTYYDAAGRPEYAIISITDITEQREQKLAYEKWVYTNKSHKADSLHYYDYNLTRDVLEAIDGNHPSIYPDQNERTFSGVAEYVANNIIHPDDRAEYLRIFDRAHLIEQFRNNITEITMDHRRFRPDGSSMRAQGVIQLFKDPFNGDVLCFVLIKDMDSLVARQTKALEEAAEAAAEATRMKSAFLANMSHEIRTPLNGVIGFTELALDEEDLPDKTRNFLEQIRVSATSLLGIINDILDISKIESGRMELEETSFSLHDVFRQCETISSVHAEEKGLMLYFYAEPYIGKRLIGDPTKLRQILLNLLSNSIKFTNKGIVKLMASVQKVDEDNVRVTFEVKDSGIGMTSDEIRKVFAPFTQADVSTTRKYGGTGLGLAITKSLVELMGGALTLESTPGLGSKFTFTLAFGTIDDDTPQEEQASSEPLAALKKPTFEGDVLVCEDNATNQFVIREHLARIGLNAVVVGNGRLGVEAVSARLRTGVPFEIILMDIHMPVMDGLTATAKMREIGITTPIVALTANAMTKDRECYLASGMTDYLSKPFKSEELWACLMRHLVPAALSPIRDASRAESTEENKKISPERYAELPSGPIDPKQGLKRSADDDKLYMRFLASFVENNQHTLDVLEREIKAGDFKDAHRTAHTLKGTASLIGAEALSDAALAVERALAAERPSVGAREMQNLGIRLDEVMLELKRFSFAHPTSTPQSETEFDEDEANELVSRLEPLLRSGNAESVDLVDDIKRILAPLGEKGALLARFVDDYDYEPALETLAEIREMLAD